MTCSIVTVEKVCRQIYRVDKLCDQHKLSGTSKPSVDVSGLIPECEDTVWTPFLIKAAVVVL